MKFHSTLIITLLSVTICFAQENATVILKTNKNHLKKYLLNIDGKLYELEKGDVAFKKSFMIDEPKFASLIAPNGWNYRFWYEPGETNLYFTKKFRNKSLKVDGSESQELYRKLQSTKSFEELKKQIQANRNKKPTLFFVNNEIEHNSYSFEQFKEIQEIILDDKKSQISDFIAFLNTFHAERLEKGNDIIDFVAYDELGNSYSTEEFRGNYLLIDIAATNCGPCWYAYPYMLKGFEKYKGKIQFITINDDNMVERWNEIAERNDLKIEWPVIWDIENGKEELMLKYEIDGFPTYILVNPDGKVIERWNFSSEKIFNMKLAKYLK